MDRHHTPPERVGRKGTEEKGRDICSDFPPCSALLYRDPLHPCGEFFSPFSPETCLCVVGEDWSKERWDGEHMGIGVMLCHIVDSLLGLHERSKENAFTRVAKSLCVTLTSADNPNNPF